jgi:hypothetical protein
VRPLLVTSQTWKWKTMRGIAAGVRALYTRHSMASRMGRIGRVVRKEVVFRALR